MDEYIFQLNEQVCRISVQYHNRYGVRLAGDLYHAKNLDKNKRYPALLIGAPYGGVKEQGPGIYANELAQRGFVVLTFDPSCNGYSGGRPRHIASPDLFVEDFHAGVDFLGTRDFVDPEKIGVIGICGSGGFALSAAQVDTRIKAVATVSMVDISQAAKMGPEGSLTSAQWYEMLRPLNQQRYQDFLEPQPALAPRGYAIQVEENKEPLNREFAEFYWTQRGYHPNSIATFTATSTMSFMNFSLLGHLQRISPRPILLIVGEQALSRFFSDEVYQQAAEPKELYVAPCCNHVDLYDRTDKIPFDKLEGFFKQYLDK